MFTRRTPPDQPRITTPTLPVRETEAPLWLQRLSLVLLVAVCVYIGIWLVVLPWTPLWNDNPLLSHLPARVTEWLQSGMARGFVSGLGLLDVWIGIYEVSAFQVRRKQGVPHA